MMSNYHNQSLPPQIPNNFPHFHSPYSNPFFSHPPPFPESNPFFNSRFNPPNYASIAAQPINYSDSYVGSSSWVVKQSTPFEYSNQAIQPLKKEAIVSENYNAPLNYNSDYEKHLSGKKHSKGLLYYYAPALKATAGKTVGFDGKGWPGASSKVAHLKAKKQKLLEGGTAVKSWRICTICNVSCNGEVAFSDHVAGKKHAAKLQERALGSTGSPNSLSGSTQETNAPSNQTRKRKNEESSLVCEVCEIKCTSHDNLQKHLSAKKHQKNLQKLQARRSKNSSARVKGTTSSEPPQKKKGQSDDVNAKKQKVLEGGADASAIRTCMICNVVCNSETVYKSHLGGQKHLAMVEQAETPKDSLQAV